MATTPESGNFQSLAEDVTPDRALELSHGCFSKMSGIANLIALYPGPKNTDPYTSGYDSKEHESSLSFSIIRSNVGDELYIPYYPFNGIGPKDALFSCEGKIPLTDEYYSVAKTKPLYTLRVGLHTDPKTLSRIQELAAKEPQRVQSISTTYGFNLIGRFYKESRIPFDVVHLSELDLISSLRLKSGYDRPLTRTIASPMSGSDFDLVNTVLDYISGQLREYNRYLS